jgi:hypothetical protein
MTAGFFVKGGEDQRDDSAIKIVDINHNPSIAEGAVNLVLNPGVLCLVSLKVNNLMATDSCYLTLSYILPEENNVMASYLNVQLSVGEKSLYTGLLQDASKKPVVSSYPLEEGKDVTFSFAYTLSQSYSGLSESLDFNLRVESRALVFGN